MKRRLWPSILAGALVGLLGAVLLRHRDIADRDSEAGAPPATATTPPSPAATRGDFAYNRGAVPQRELAPADERYNPVTFLREDDLTPREIFEREPRDHAFAPVLEQRIRAGYSSAFEQLGITGRVVSLSIECKTLSCHTSVEVAKADADYVYKRINGLLIGSLHAPAVEDAASPELTKLTFDTLFEPELRDDLRFRAFMDRVFAPLVRAFEVEYPSTPGPHDLHEDEG